MLPAIRATGSYALKPMNLAQALRAYADEVEARENAETALGLAETEIALLEPAAEAFHQWQESDSTVYVVEWAKTIGLTQNQAYEALRECGILFKQRTDGGHGTSFNVPRAGYEKYFVMVDEWIKGLNEYVKVPKITAECQVVLAEILTENGWLSR